MSEKIETRGVFSGTINGRELNISSSTAVDGEAVEIEHRSMDGKRGVKDRIVDRRTARTIGYLESRKSQLAAAEAYRNAEVTPIWKPERSGRVTATAFTICPDCEGSGYLEGGTCPACRGDGRRWV